MENSSKIAWTKEWEKGRVMIYTWLSNQLKYFSSETASTAIGINPWYTPQVRAQICPQDPTQCLAMIGMWRLILAQHPAPHIWSSRHLPMLCLLLGSGGSLTERQGTVKNY